MEDPSWVKGCDLSISRATRDVGPRKRRVASGSAGGMRLAKFWALFGKSHSRCVGAQMVAMRSRVTRGDVTTYRPEHVVNRADRTPVAVGPRQIRNFDNGGCEAVTKPSILSDRATRAVGHEWLW